MNSMLLNGVWEFGEERDYTQITSVPGIVTDPSIINRTSIWYRKRIQLPIGEWTYATLFLNGARFCPRVYVDGDLVSQKSGGMTVTKHLLKHPSIKSGNNVDIEIELMSLKDVDEHDASRIPSADLWRTNVSSCLWDKVELKFHGTYSIERVIPFVNLKEDELGIYWKTQNLEGDPQDINLEITILDDKDKCLLIKRFNNVSLEDRKNIKLNNCCELWSPEAPNLYKLRVAIVKLGKIIDSYNRPLGIKEFKTEGLGFLLNNYPVVLRAGSVVWHRWVRDPEGRELGFNTEWFEKNIVLRLKEHGANTLRFHLGMPPEALLDLCDKYGLLVQVEWSFFHGMKGSKESLIEQWRNWLDLCMRHPCTAIIHAWNETEGDELVTAKEVLEILSLEYPPLVIGHRDVLHIHKYWWGLFENLGLYYDSASQFSMPIMVDEIGGNYLDGDCNPGLYPTVKESLLRFLGRNHSREQRLQLHTESNSKIAEYWRRLGAAGFSPFCILGSREDGSHHFLGSLKEGIPKPVWDNLTASYSPLSCSLEIWDKNFEPSQKISLPLFLLNDTGIEEELVVEVKITNKLLFDIEGHNEIPEEVLEKIPVIEKVKAYSKKIVKVELTLPHKEGEWCFKAELINSDLKHKVVSCWNFRTINVLVPHGLKDKCIAVPYEEKELKALLRTYNIKTTDVSDVKADVILMSAYSWNNSKVIKEMFETAITRGCSVVLLNIGPGELGQGYLSGDDLGPLQGVMVVDSPEIEEKELCFGIKVLFKQAAEPESFIHPSLEDCKLWNNLNTDATGIWNGLRGGLIVPARDMEIVGLSQDAFIAQWRNKGADWASIKRNNYFGYELEGFYAFSRGENEEVKEHLKRKVRLLFDDAPALQTSINPEAPVKVYNLTELYRECKQGVAEELLPLVNCGKSLSRTPVVRVSFGQGKGNIILSQLLTEGRLVEGFGQKGLYGIRRDPAAIQFTLNMIDRSLD